MRLYEPKIVYDPLLFRETGGLLLDSPDKIFEVMEGAALDCGNPMVEFFWVIALSRKNRSMGRFTVTQGTATASLVHPREVLKPVILSSASAFVCVHNHPSGDPSPSQADIRATRQLREASKVMQLDLLDHVIVGQKEADPSGQGFYSFAEAGLL